MTIKDLIAEKDYDYVSYRIALSDGTDIFAGCFRSKGGKIISLDGDVYSPDEVVLEHETWTMPEEGITNGLTIVVPEE